MAFAPARQSIAITPNILENQTIEGIRANRAIGVNGQIWANRANAIRPDQRSIGGMRELAS